MHKSCYKRFEWFIENYKEYFGHISNGDVISVLDVGGRDINGNLDNVLSKMCCKKTVLDIEDGEAVDYIHNDPYSWDELRNDSFDFVYSVNTFQHIEFFWRTIKEVNRVLRPNGIFLMIAPSMRYDGRYPDAYWAFNRSGLNSVAMWGNLSIISSTVAGVPDLNVDQEWDSPLDDAMLIACKGRPDNSLPYLPFERRCHDYSIDKINTMKKVICAYLESKDCYKRIIDNNLVMVYGCGDLGEVVGKILIDSGFKVLFLDRYQCKIICGNKSIKPEQIGQEQRDNGLVICTVMEEYLFPDIKSYLLNLRYSRIVHVTELIEKVIQHRNG